MKLSRKSLLHLGYWILITIIFLVERSYMIRKLGLPYFLQGSAVRIALLVALSYANSYWLMPVYLLRKKYLDYCILLAALLIGYIVLQSAYDYYLYGFILGSKNSNLFIVLLLNSFNTIWYLVLSVALKLSIDWYEQGRTLQQTRIEKLQAEINYLRAQVNPHFLFNVLNSLYSLTIKKSDLAPEVVLKLSEMMEYMLYESDAAFVPLEKELAYLENYLELEKLRHGNEADIRFELNGEAQGREIAPFMLLPLVENAFKHGVSKALHDAWLHIRINISPETLRFSIGNSRLNHHERTTHGGIGLVNLQERLDLLYPGRYTLAISEEKDRFTLHLTLQFT